MLILNNELQDTYQILEEIGSGGGGTVFKAYHKRLQKYVVLKKIHSNLTKGNLVNIRAEADILKNLKHEYLPQVLDFFEIDGDVYTVMDFIPGQSLKKYLVNGKRFEQKAVIKWFEQLCQAVEQLHKQKPPIVHGDIKPDNIMLTPEDNICLIDFNVSGDFSEREVAGFTPGYASPEQVTAFRQRKAKMAAVKQAVQDITQVSDSTMVIDSEETQVDTEPYVPSGSSDIDVRSDIYSIGATMYHLLTGQQPGSDGVIPIDKFGIKLEDSLVYIIKKCMEPNPDNRYQNIDELHNAVINVHKSTKEYKQLIRRQRITRVVLAVSTMAFVSLAWFGIIRMKQERESDYANLVNMERNAREQGDAVAVEDYYQKAVKIFQDREGAYLEKLYLLYDSKQYEQAIAFADNVIFNSPCPKSSLAEIYYIYGNCCFELESYNVAQSSIGKAIAYGHTTSQAYRDYAISLARAGYIDEAKRQLDIAVKAELGQDSIYYAQGEISMATGDKELALEDFKKCINETHDDYMKMRAYVVASDIINGQNHTKETIGDNIALLKQGTQELPGEYMSPLLEQLAQAYIDMATITNDTSYDNEAISVLNQIMQFGWATYTTYQNKAILLQKQKKYDEEYEVLQTMLDYYGDNYNTYKRLAFMEAGKQALIENANRNYSSFDDYYKKAVELYESQLGNNNKTDAEMTSLKNLYSQAVSGGWLTER